MKNLILILSCALIFTFDYFAQEWTQKADIETCRYDGVTMAIGDNVYYGLGLDCFGGETTDFQKFDPETNIWTNIAIFPGSTRRRGTAFSLNGKGYVGLGYSNGVSLNDFWEYDPTTDAWTQKSDFPGSPRGAAFGEVVGNKAYVGTGFGPGSTLYPMDLWEYTQETDSWSQKSDLPFIALYSAQSFAIGDNLYIIGGTGGELLLPLKSLWEYSIQNDTWLQKSDFPGQARWDAAAFTIGNTGYCGFGSIGTTYQADFYAYQSSSDIWTSSVSNGTGGMLFDGDAVSIGNKAYCVSGVTTAAPNPPSSQTWEFVVDSVSVGISELDETIISMTIQSYPNPVENAIVVNVAITGTYSIYNTIGQIVKNIYLTEKTPSSVDLSVISSGKYFIVFDDDLRYRSSFFKQ